MQIKPSLKSHLFYKFKFNLKIVHKLRFKALKLWVRMLLYIMYPIIFIEIVVILILLFRTPLRKYVMKGLGKSPVVTQTLSATLFVLFISSLYALFDLYKHFTDEAAINPTEQALMFHHLIEAAFLGNFL